jgi:hypothetical protein
VASARTRGEASGVDIGSETNFPLPGFAIGTDQTKFIAKVQAFLRQHLDHVAVRYIASTEISIDSVPMLFVDLVSLGGYSGGPVILEATGHMLCR